MIEERLKEINKELGSLEDELMQYSFLVELSSYVKAVQKELQTDQNLQHGCQSQVWLACRIEDGLFYLNATSDTMLIRGVLYIMMELFNGLPPEEILKRKINFLEECGISKHFSNSRTSGLQTIIDSIYSFCEKSL